MSRVGKEPISLPQGVEVKLQNGILTVKGSKGSLDFRPHPRMKIEIGNGRIVVSRPSDAKSDKALQGVTRTIINNNVKGVSEGFTRELNIAGVGFRAAVNGKKLVLNLGFSHPVEFDIPEGIKIEAVKAAQLVENMPTQHLTIKGIDKMKVGEVASEIRSFYPPEPYKGKGIRYKDEVVRRKAGKAVAAAA